MDPSGLMTGGSNAKLDSLISSIKKYN